MANYDLGTIGYTVQNTGAPKSIAELKEFAQAGLEAHRNSNQLSQGNRLSQYFASVDKQITAVNRSMQNHNRYLAQAEQGSSRFGVVTQQAGYQIGDFLVQVQSGTNWMVAFGQQATQLVGILPLLEGGFMGLSTGALVALSAGLGIAIPLVTAIGAAFMRTSSEAGDGSKGVDTYTEALKSLTEEIQRNQEAFLKAKFGVDTAGRAQALQQEVVLQKEIADSQARILQIEAQLDSFRSGRGAAYINLALGGKKEELALEEENLAKLQENLRIIEAQNEAQNMLNGGLSVAAGIQRGLVYDKQVELQNAQELLQSHSSQLEIMGKAKVESELFKDGLVGASVAARSVAEIMFSNISFGADEALRMASNLTQASLNYGKIMNTGDSGPDAARRSVMGLNAVDITGTLASGAGGVKPIARSGGSGGGRSSQLKKEIELTKELTQAEKDRQTILKSIEGSLESGFMSMVDGTKSVKSAFRSMAAEIIKELYRVLVVQRLVGAISGGIGMFSGPSTGSLGLPFGLATGGSMMSNQPYLVGENGPELVIPRHSGTVVNANQTAGAMGGSGTTVVNNNISVTGSDAAMVRTEIAKMIPQITNATKAAVIDAKQRGGQMAAAFR